MKNLQEQIRQLEHARRPAWGVVSSGLPPLDRLLPERGFRRGALVEWLGDEGSGAAALAMLSAREACRAGEAFVVVDPGGVFYPPAAASLGIDLTRTILVRPRNPTDLGWAFHQALQCPGVGAVLGWPEKLTTPTFRRWQLTAESGGTLGLLLRSPHVRGQPVWSEIQLLVEPCTNLGAFRRLRVELTRCRSGGPGASVELEFDDETGNVSSSRSLPVASPVAAAARA